MSKRYMTIWFSYLCTDWFTLRKPELKGIPFVLAAPDHGRMRITAVNPQAHHLGVENNMTVADARVLAPGLKVLDDKPGLDKKLLGKLAEWCIRYSPHVAVDMPDGLKLDISGCAHLWGGEMSYLQCIVLRFQTLGYHVNAAIAGSIGSAWACCRYQKDSMVIEQGHEIHAIQNLPAASLRIDIITSEKLYKLGLYQVHSFLKMPGSALKRRFGNELIQRLNQALGIEEEWILPVIPAESWQERLPCLEPICTATGISIALERLLDSICCRLQKEEKGLRIAVFSCYRIDGKSEVVEIGTHRPTHNPKHLYKLFENKLGNIEPGLGIELFVLEAKNVEILTAQQKTIWGSTGNINDKSIAELLDRIAGKFGSANIHRYMPAEHYWPERSFKKTSSITEEPTTYWRTDKPRPLYLFNVPDRIEVSAPIPDYPPMLFRYKNMVHRIVKADGPERIEQEWWLQEGEHRDYYCVEDEEGRRYWLFRSGHYDAERANQWYLHGIFA